jgi:hypothetical protein
MTITATITTITEVGAEARGALASEFLNPQGGALGEYWVHNGRFVSEERLQVSNGSCTVVSVTVSSAVQVYDTIITSF